MTSAQAYPGVWRLLHDSRDRLERSDNEGMTYDFPGAWLMQLLAVQYTMTVLIIINYIIRRLRSMNIHSAQ